MILCIGTTPAAQRVMVFQRLAIDAVNRAANTADGIAGKSINVAKVLKALGENPIATGFIGGQRGQSLRESLEARHIEAEFITVSPETRQCITVIDESAGTITELVEESRSVTADEFEKLMKIIERRAGSCRAFIMSGTITPGGPATFYQGCTELARHSGALAIVDAQGPALTHALRSGPDLVKPNRQELARTLECDLRTETEVIAAMQKVHELGARRVVVTAGKDATLASDGKSIWRIVPPPIKPVNPIGSGDAFTAGVTWKMLHGENLGEACRWAAACGAANALSLMPGELDFADVKHLALSVLVEKVRTSPAPER